MDFSDTKKSVNPPWALLCAPIGIGCLVLNYFLTIDIHVPSFAKQQIVVPQITEPLVHGSGGVLQSQTPQFFGQPSGISRSVFIRAAAAALEFAPIGEAKATTPANQVLPEGEFLAQLLGLKAPIVKEDVPAEFVVYLTGYLIRFDSEWRSWWRDQIKRTPSYYRPAYIFDSNTRQLMVRERYREVTRALRLRLQCVQTKDLCRLLYTLYGPLPGKSPKHQLAILFSFLDGRRQPADLIIAALRQELAENGLRLSPTEVKLKHSTYERMLQPKPLKVATESVSLISGFYTPQLLPADFYPLYDAELRRWIVPESPEINKFPNDRNIVISSYEIYETYQFPNSVAFTWFTVMFLAYSGGLSNAVTYSLVQPLEVIKTRMQSSKRNLIETVQDIADHAGWRGLTLGTGATSVGMFMYGFVIFPMFELGKLYLSGTLGEDVIASYRLPSVLFISIICTLVGSFFLVPFETAKIRMISDPEKYVQRPSQQDPSVLLQDIGSQDGAASLSAPFPTKPEMLSLFGVFHRIRQTEGWASLWSGYPVLCLRNIMCNVGRFMVFDCFDDAVLFMNPAAQQLLAEQSQYSVAVLLGKGAIAGMAAAVFSTPADSVLTKVTRGPRRGLSIPEAAREVYREQGLPGFFRGVVPRVAWAMLLNAPQFFIYQGLKDLFFDSLISGRV